MFRKIHGVLVLGIILCLTPIFLLRRDPSEPNLEVVMERQMARTPAFGAYSPNPNFPDNLTLRQPVPGTIAQGVKPFNYGPTPVEAARAGKELKNPLSHGNPEARRVAVRQLLPILSWRRRPGGWASVPPWLPATAQLFRFQGQGNARWRNVPHHHPG